MKQILIIPDRQDMEASFELVKNYGVGFEYNDFFHTEVLDDVQKSEEIMMQYKRNALPKYCTMHGAFFDVTPLSPDKKIREVSDLRIRQSIEAAKKIEAKAVVFHTNYNPFLNSQSYINDWLEKGVSYWSSILDQNPEINIYLENMFDRTPDILEQLSLKLCSYDNYGVCLDYAHAFLSKTVPEEWARRLGRFTKHVHINDNDGSSDLHMAWGDGVICRERFYQSYNEYLNGATVVIETSENENKIRSLQRLMQDGFID